jgi:hypothetical protein
MPDLITTVIDVDFVPVVEFIEERVGVAPLANLCATASDWLMHSILATNPASRVSSQRIAISGHQAEGAGFFLVLHKPARLKCSSLVYQPEELF